LNEKAMTLAAATTLMTDGRRRPGWFGAASTVLNTAINTRNQVSSAYFNHPTNELKLTLKKARKAVKRKVKQALTDRTEHVVAEVNGKASSNDRRPLTPKDIWAAIRESSNGPRTAKDLKPFRLRKDQQPGGANTLCSNLEENTQVMVENLKKTFSTYGSFDIDAVNSVPLRPLRPWLDNPFSEHEVTAAVRKRTNGESAVDSKCPVEYYKALRDDKELLNFLCEMMNEYWESGSFPQGDIASGPPPYLTVLTIKLAAKNGWRHRFIKKVRRGQNQLRGDDMKPIKTAPQR
jgi:hypothetical protein